jgi:hypothetical protein
VGDKGFKIALFTGGGDKPYALGLLSAFISKDITVDFIGSDELNTPEIIAERRVNFFDLWDDQKSKGISCSKNQSCLKILFASSTVCGED